MPCNCDYMEQSVKEKQLQKTAELLIFTLKKLNKSVPRWVTQASKNYYCNEEKSVPELCSLIRNMNEKELDNIVYNGRDKNSRDLANWWDLHQEADKLREEKINKEKQQKLIKERVLEKLSLEERKALGIH